MTSESVGQGSVERVSPGDVLHPADGAYRPPAALHSQRLRVLVVDDEELARLRLKALVGECSDPPCTVVGEAANTVQALVWLTRQHCDLVLVDVQMPGRDGTQLAAELRLRSPSPAVVFVTAHAEHALRAFDLEAVDFLTKPVRRERLQMALARVAQRLAVGSAAAVPTAVASNDDRDDVETPVIIVSDRGRVIRVPVNEVLYLKAELKYVTPAHGRSHACARRLARRPRRAPRRALPARAPQRAGRASRRARARTPRPDDRRRRRGIRGLGGLHGAGRRMAGRVEAPGGGGARGAGGGGALSRAGERA